MKNNKKIIYVFSLIILILIILILNNTTSKNQIKSKQSKYINTEYIIDESDMINGESLINGIEKTTLSEKEIMGLIQMREEEKLAKDVYITLGNNWSINIFNNISNSEQTHTDAIKVLLNRYGIEDPVKDNGIGVFESKEIQKLYNDFIVQGKKSLMDALIIGATVEDLDIYDLENLKNETNKEDFLITYNNLQKGSRNHMRAFIKNIKANNGEYTPQFISIDTYSSIISSPQERGKN